MNRNAANLSKFVSVRWAALPLALAILVAMASRSEASILQGNVFASADETLAMLGQDQGAGSSSSSQESSRSQGSTPQTPEDDSDKTPLHAISPNSPIHEGSTSSSSPSSGGSAGGSMPFVASGAAFGLADNSTSTRLAICQSIFLPTPPGVDLLRPPRI